MRKQKSDCLTEKIILKFISINNDVIIADFERSQDLKYMPSVDSVNFFFKEADVVSI